MSMKKSLLILIAVIVIVTAVSVVTSGGDAMLIDMSDSAISFSGIGDFAKTIPYSEITGIELVDAGNTQLLGLKDETYKAGLGSSLQSMEITYEYFVTTKTDDLVVLTLSDGTLMLFNYNNTSDTEAIYKMLLENLQ